MVHQQLNDFWRVFGERDKNLSCDTIHTSQTFCQHSHNSKVYVKAFSPYTNSDEIEHLFQLASKRGGDERSYELRKEVDMMSASPGVIVSKTGKFMENGGILGVDFAGFNSLKLAQIIGVINWKVGKKPNRKNLMLQMLRNNINERGVCFVPNSNGSTIPNYGKGVLVKFSGYVHARKGRSETLKGSIYPAEES
jgi:hypothetical protein